MAKITLALEPREPSGKKVKKSRQQGLIPGNIFGKKVTSTPVQVKATLFRPVLNQAGETQIVYLHLPDEKDNRPVLITNIQRDPLTDDILHIDFHQVDLKEKVTANIPVEIVGESPAIKDFSASLITSLSEVEVEALPTDLPEKIIIDVSSLKNIGDSIKVSDLDIDRSKVEVIDNHDSVVITVVEQQKEEVIPVAPIIEAETAESTTAAQTPTESAAKTEEKTAPQAK